MTQFSLNNRQIILASRSPRRKTLLSQLGVVVTSVMDTSIDEAAHKNESAHEYVLRMSTEKAVAAYQSLHGKNRRAQYKVNVLCDKNADLPIILAADTCISYNENIIGKPEGAEHGFEILTQLSGNVHRVLSAVCLLDIENEVDYSIYTRVNTTTVEFKRLSDQEIKQYWSSGEPIDKAGGYAIQGLGAMFIKRISGSYSGVMGMPLFETAEMLSHCGVGLFNTAS